ncbi:MAG: hypothetical protein LBM04_08360, partial [Opitutaceae bacterium]|nr:hypothetical protein [Opitutaceae bacterium]
LTLSDYPVIPLAAELDFVNDYLSLEHLRHEDRLRIQKNITPEALCENIPPMLLQTLVENAVKHGLNQRSDGIDVTCDIWLAPPAGDTPPASSTTPAGNTMPTAGTPLASDIPPTSGTTPASGTPPASGTTDAHANLHLRVTNQGALATGAVPIFPEAAAAHTTGTGLHNARERLRLIYGGRASLTVSQQGKLIVAEAVIPITTTSPTTTTPPITPATTTPPITTTATA